MRNDTVLSEALQSWEGASQTKTPGFQAEEHPGAKLYLASLGCEDPSEERGPPNRNSSGLGLRAARAPVAHSRRIQQYLFFK